MAAGRLDGLVAQTQWIASILGCPLSERDLQQMNPYRPPEAPMVEEKTPEERAAENKAGWALLFRHLGLKSRKYHG